MDCVYNSVGPLSPFLWPAPHANLVPPGYSPGTVADTMLHISDLTLSLDVLAKALDHSYHPVLYAMETHQLHTRVLYKRQFDLMQYGMVLDEVERLVIVRMPALCGDSGKKVSQEYAALCEDDLNSAPCARHPILPEHCLIVYQLPAKGDGNDAVPTPLFRLVFRNESFNESMKRELADKFPLYRLRSVYVSHKIYYPLRHQVQLYNEASAESVGLPDFDLEESLGLKPLRQLLTAWMMVLEGIAPSWLVDKGVGPDVVTLFLAHHRPEGKYDVKEVLQAYDQLPVENRVRCSYYLTAKRMEQRIKVMPRFPNMINTWRKGSYDVEYFSEVASGTEPTKCLAPCFRMLLCNRKPGRNYVEDDEVAAFIPTDAECEPLQVYNTLAAERLRLWVLKGLLTAELHGIHNLMIEFDVAMVVSECVGLLWGGDEEQRRREVIFHVCKIIVETVEDYVQHSGVIWCATIVTSDEESIRSAELCKDILEVTQIAKARVEIEEGLRVASSGKEDTEEAPSASSETGVSTPGDEKEAHEQVDEVAADPVDNLLCIPGTFQTITNCQIGVVPCRQPFITASKISEDVRDRAMRCGVRLSDAELYPIFLALSGGEETVPISKVVGLILEKQEEATNTGGRRARGSCSMLWPHDHPICALDFCGVPWDVVSVTNFVKGFQRRPYRAWGTKDYRASLMMSGRCEESDTLNYVEFSIMMLALARQ
ncbi:hypothetical protein, conserved [Trypanosoma brucei gambiense DAL972]|uniref:Paraflagellar rod component n=1 Tax=Trypanosoma brucei gambiense (strain MHOM/CI/86/DAL972) TaxID=679716 RepID=D0A406_TRYB9|nr:hypothetical protein, conserved [Trypanosoma brucei gambiense DAL972]CBH16000.1 hypothetical protein, conserved [Trypanosoma brucei gambiense DAL972]|eukprot:XP_011778264.1 hypothetical protein, conserved [Trypanosoma brucei gambiense DAL972]